MTSVSSVLVQLASDGLRMIPMDLTLHPNPGTLSVGERGLRVSPFYNTRRHRVASLFPVPLAVWMVWHWANAFCSVAIVLDLVDNMASGWKVVLAASGRVRAEVPASNGWQRVAREGAGRCAQVWEVGWAALARQRQEQTEPQDEDGHLGVLVDIDYLFSRMAI